MASTSRRVYFRPEGWYYLFVIVFVVGGAVLRNVNVLVALAGLMAAALIIHWRLVLRSLAGLDVVRDFPVRIGAGELLEVEVSIINRQASGDVWALEFSDEFQRADPPDDDPPSSVKLLFPRVPAGQTATRRYHCLLTRRGVYRFGKARLITRYPLGLVEGTCYLDLPDRLVVYPTIGELNRNWQRLVEADPAGQLTTRHRRGMSEGDFYALREWRNGDSQRWIHWRTSAKLGNLAVRQFEQRRSSDVVLVLDLYSPASSTTQQRLVLEETISLAATAVLELSRQGGARLGLVVASSSVGCWSGPASLLFAYELLEHLAVCRSSESVRLSEASDKVGEVFHEGSKLLVLSTRSRAEAAATLDRRTREGVRWRLLEQGVWLNGSAREFTPYFTIAAESRP